MTAQLPDKVRDTDFFRERFFRYQPSPFCILDEVDAPLDEPNIERLMRLLKEMSLETQFILITHFGAREK